LLTMRALVVGISTVLRYGMMVPKKSDWVRPKEAERKEEGLETATLY